MQISRGQVYIASEGETPIFSLLSMYGHCGEEKVRCMEVIERASRE